MPDPTERPSAYKKDLLFNKLVFHMHFDVIYYGLIAQESFTEEQA